MSVPTGVVAILFTDLVGSTELLERLGDEAAEELRTAHFALLRQAVAKAGGEEVKSTGDGLMVAFANPLEAVGCAVAIQQAVEEQNQAHPDQAVGVRIGVQVGQPVRTEDDYHGLAVNVAKRLCDRAAGGQILTSELVAGLVGPRGTFRIRSAGRLVLKGIEKPVAAVAVEWGEGPAPPAPPPKRPRSPTVRGPRLVGRESELARLEAELDRAAGGEFRCLLVVADPGVGKTRLAAELLARHPEVLGLSARAYPLGGTASFGLWAEALDRHLRGLAPEEVVELCGGLLDDLAALLRSVAALRGSVPERQPARSSLLEALAVLVANLARREPVTVVLDDVHWADASSWEALRYLADHASDAPVLVLALARPAELAEQQSAAEVLLGLEQDDLLARLSLRLLDRQGTADLAAAVLGHEPPAALVDWLTERALGNPLFAIGLVRALRAEGADLNAPALRSLPEGLADRVLARVRALDEPATDTLEVLAVLGCRVELAELVRVSERSLDDLGAVLDGLVRSRLVVAEERGVEVVFEIAHPLISETIYQGIGFRRRALHRRVGRALLASGRLGEAAPHFAHSGEVGDPEAVDALREAMAQAEEREAYREALTILSALVDLLPEGDERWVEVADAMSWTAQWVVEHRADAFAVTGARALRAIDAVLEASPERYPDRLRRAGVKFRLAVLLAWGTGDAEAAERHLWKALDLYQGLGDTHHVLLTGNELAWMRAMQGDYKAMELGGAEIVAAAQAAGEVPASLQALTTQAWGAYFRGRFTESEAGWTRVVTLARDTGNAYRIPYALSLLAASRAMEGRIAEAWPLLEEAKAVGSTYRETVLVELESTINWLGGDFRASARGVEEVVAWNPEGLSLRRYHHLFYGVHALAETGRLAEARQFLTDVRTALAGRPWIYSGEHGDWLDCFLMALEGEGAPAAAPIERAVRRLRETGARPLAAFALAALAEVAGVAGDAHRTAEAASCLVALASELDRDLYRALAGIASAWAALAAGRAEEAAAVARTAADTLSSLGYRAFYGRALDVLGRALATIDPPGAVHALREAAAVFDACGAAWRREAAERVLVAGAGRKGTE